MKKIRLPSNVESIVFYNDVGSQRQDCKVEGGFIEVYSDTTAEAMVKEGIQEYTGPTPEEARLAAEGKRPLAPGQAAPASVANSPGTDLSNTKPGDVPKPITANMLEQEQKAREAQRVSRGTKEPIPEGPVTVAELEKREAESKKVRDEAAKHQKEIGDKAAKAAGAPAARPSPPMQTSRS